MARLGGAVPIGSTGFACSLAWRVEGLPRYDVFGAESRFPPARRGDVPRARGELRQGQPRLLGPDPVRVLPQSLPQPVYGEQRRRDVPEGTSSWRPTATGLAAHPNPTRRSLPSERALRAVSVGQRPQAVHAQDARRRATKTLPNVLGKATLVVFFYPTCPFCNVAAPEIQRLYDTYKAQGLSVVYINTTPNEEKLVPGWLDEHHYTVPVLVGARLNDVQRDYAVEATPTHYLLDARGQVLSKHSGYQPGDAVALEQEIRNALTTVGSSQ